MEEFAKGLRTMLNWIADLPEGVLGLILVALIIMWIVRD